MCPPTKLAVAVWLAAVCCLAAGSEQRGSGYQLEDLGLGEALPPDPAYLLPRLAQKFSALQQGERWQHVLDPKVYLLTETADQDMTGGMAPARRLKRTNGPSLSIVNPLDVLRQRLLLEIARRRMRQSEDQVIANREWLKTIGKRSIDQQSLREMEKSSDLDHGNHGRDGHS